MCALHFELDYATLPGPVVNAWLTGDIKALELKIYMMVQNYSRSREGCFVLNETFAEWFGTTPSKASNAIANLKNMGFVEQIRFDGRKRYLRTVGVERVVCKGNASTGKPVDSGLPRKGNPELPRKGNQRSLNLNKSTVRSADGSDEYGFGIVEPRNTNTHVTEFDIHIATKLLEVCRGHLGATHPRLKRSRPTRWAEHIRLLRTTDEIPEERIQKVLTWYTANIGDEFCPHAFNAEAFRQKFDRIEAAAARDVLSHVTISPEAARVAKRLGMMGWPKGAVEALPAAIQACLDAYGGWLRGAYTFVDRLHRDDLVEDYPDRKRLAVFGTAILTRFAVPTQFAESWMREVHARVSTWEGWSGELGPYVFRPELKKFRNLGRGHAEQYCGDPGRWDRFIEILHRESSL